MAGMTKSQAPEKPAKNATTKQSRRPPAKRGRKPGLNAAEKTERDCNLIRRRLSGLPWSEVAREFRLLQSQAREIFAAWRDTHDPLPEVPEDPINFLVESLCRLALIGERYACIANDERVDLGHRMAAMKAQMRVVREEFDMRSNKCVVVDGYSEEGEAGGWSSGRVPRARGGACCCPGEADGSGCDAGSARARTHERPIGDATDRPCT
jgi:hypothetical protein